MSSKIPDYSLDFQKYTDSILENNDAVLAGIYAENYPAVEKYIVQNSGTADDAKDIFQEAFIVLWRNIHLKKFIPENKQSVGAYLYRVSKNKWISHLRSAAHKHYSVLKSEIEDLPEEPADERFLLINKVVANMQQIGEQCKELLVLFYYKRMKLLAIAGHFGWTEATAKNNKYRCLEKLRSMLKNQNN